MKCQSVACLWSGAPPSHRVTATAVLNRAPTLYTGGSDGSIIWWNLSDPKMEVKPIAMLCGHAAPIADLSICYPAVLSQDGKTTDWLNGHCINHNLDVCGALISACADGVLCVWSRSSGHCRRRRKLPPWVGSPTIVRTLSSNPRFICVGCSFVNGSHLSNDHSFDSAEGVDVLADKEHQNRKSPKCTVVIVDTYTLTIAQTVFHGTLSIGPLKFMEVIQVAEEKESLLMTDSFGRLQMVLISKELQSDGESVSGVGKSSSQLQSTILEDWVIDGENVISMITCGKFVALVFRSRCVIRLVDGDDSTGEIPFVENFVSAKDHCSHSHILGATFLDNCDVSYKVNGNEGCKLLSGNIVVWDNKGHAVVYHISFTDKQFEYRTLGEIPAPSHHLEARLSFSFIQLRQHVLRIESRCFDLEEPFLWQPYITIWSLHCENNDFGDVKPNYKMIGHGSPFVDWFSSSDSHDKSYVSQQGNGSHLESACAPDLEDKSYNFQKGRVVSSSMVISENLYAPYAVVYGFYSGEIEIVRFDLLHGLDSPAGSPRLDSDSLVSRQQFLGHTGAVLCLGAHRMVGSAKGWSFHQVLISGSVDCTVRIWDLDTGDVIMIMHHHVAPVRQIILPPAQTERPWIDCFLSVGEDSGVALASLETLRMERMFPGHPNYPSKVVWDGLRGYIACLCRCHSKISDATDVLYIWDVKTGSQERILRGTASQSMFDHFCKAISMNSTSGAVLNANTSVSSLLHIDEERNLSQFSLRKYERVPSSSSAPKQSTSQGTSFGGRSAKHLIMPSIQARRYPIKCTCPFPGISALTFDLSSLTFSCQKHELKERESDKQEKKELGADTPRAFREMRDDRSPTHMASTDSAEAYLAKALEEYVIRFSLSFLHLWGVDLELDQLLITEMKLRRPENFILASGLVGDKGSMTLTFPGLFAMLELWKSSSEFCAMRSLMMVSLAQCMTSLSLSGSSASSALAAFYTRNFADKFPDLKPPLLQLLVSFWQDGSEHVRLAARSIFHCAASRAIPAPLCSCHASEHVKLLRSLSGIGENEDQVSNVGENPINGFDSESLQAAKGSSQDEDAELHAWLESFEMQDWISCVGGTSQDAMASHIIVSAALSIWYPSLVKPSLAMVVIHPLIKLVVAMNEKYSTTAAELLAEGMETTWRVCIGSEIHRLISDIFFQIECVSGTSTNPAGMHPAVPASIKEALVGVLLPSLAMADVVGFLNVVERQIWSTASDSPVHLVSLRILIKIVRNSPKDLILHLDKVVNFIMQTMDPANSVLRKTCLQTSLAAIKEIMRVFPMVALNGASTRLAVGDAVAEANNASIQIYDMQSVTKIKVLDASGPPGVPSLLGGASENLVTAAISALCFSPDGQGLVAFSAHGLMIRWWSLGSVWWEKLSRSLTPIQCTKLIYVPPWEGFSPSFSRASVMQSIMGHDKEAISQETSKNLSHAERVKQVVSNLDLSYRLEWIGDRKVLLTLHGSELGTFPL